MRGLIFAVVLAAQGCAAPGPLPACIKWETGYHTTQKWMGDQFVVITEPYDMCVRRER